MFKLPEHPQFAAHPKVLKIYSQRMQSIEPEAGQTIRWATAEALAFASLLMDGIHVRLSGQDVERGTFNQRHAVLYDQELSILGNEVAYKPWTSLQKLDDVLQAVRSNLQERALVVNQSALPAEAREAIQIVPEQNETDEMDEEIYAGPYSFHVDKEKNTRDLRDKNATNNYSSKEHQVSHSIVKDCDLLSASREALNDIEVSKIENKVELIRKSMMVRKQQRIDARRALRWCGPKEMNGASHVTHSGNVEMEICNSPLSEEALIGFEHGYSLFSPDIMAVFEHQFGDFSNCAQTMIDTFIANGEEKWARSSGMVILCPHGYEGQGPDHSSGRMERFLQLCNESHEIVHSADILDEHVSLERTALASANMHVLNMTSPAQYFHALRRQMLLPLRKPLVIFTPKYLLVCICIYFYEKSLNHR
jgi:2-oxoglutarate dehydrogenase complex dehydrogenase (E1) component-like enzyme